MNDASILTPAQKDFLGANIPDFNTSDWLISIAGKAGSERSFIRITNALNPSKSYVMVVWDARDADWSRFLVIQDELSRSMRVLPAIFAVDERHGLILEEDLGEVSLKSEVEKMDDEEEVEKLYRRVLDKLCLWHSYRISEGSAIAERCMNEEMFMWESEYFATHCLVEYFGLDYLIDSEWELERKRLAETASLLKHVCMHRDFQSENIMLDGERVRFVDFQGARLGPAEYDVASLLYDPYVSKLDGEIITRLFEYYRKNSPAAVSLSGFHTAAIQRLLQALGAFCNLSIHKNKTWYQEFIPIALSRLSAVLESNATYPAIKNAVGKCLASDKRIVSMK